MMSRNSTNEPSRSCASIGVLFLRWVAIRLHLGDHAFGANAAVPLADMAEDLASRRCSRRLSGIAFDSDKDWDERDDQYKMSGKIVKSFNVTKTAEGDKSGGYTTVVAAAVFVCDTNGCDSALRTEAMKPRSVDS